MRMPLGRRVNLNGLRKPLAQSFVQTLVRSVSAGQKGCEASPLPSRSTCMILPAMLLSL